MKWLKTLFSNEAAATLYLRYFGFTKIPLLFYVSPSIIEVTDEQITVKIRLRRKTKNHLGSMYFGALSIGADCAAGALAVRHINNSPARINFIFKQFKAEFHKRVEADVHFVCNQGNEIARLVNLASRTDERVESTLHVVATIPGLDNEPVATFSLTLSLKRTP
jgi:acyl-coenzyme A thioesterase PaaI-like protein